MKKINRFKLRAFAAMTATLRLFSGAGNALANQQLVDQLSQLKLNVKIVDNRAADSGLNCAALGGDWAIYFHSARQTLKVDNDQFNIFDRRPVQAGTDQ